jgi:UDP-N-acetylmuramate--alanine ligase
MMMTLPENIKKIYFLGIGGIGISALARYFRSKGIAICGYDKTPTPLTDELASEGMLIHFDDDPSAIPDDLDIAIYTPAVPKNMLEYRSLAESGKPLLKRAEVTGMITRGKTTIAIAGTHGKTSISAMTAHILHQAAYPVTALIGGISKNYQSNFISSGNEDIMLVEADEYDRSFLHIHPDIAVISAMDPDHLDIYGTGPEVIRSFQDFARNIKPGGKLIIRDGLELSLNSDTRRIDYASGERSDIFAVNLRYESGVQVFDMLSCEVPCLNIKLQTPGRHNVENMLAAIAVCKTLGLERERIRSGIESFTGVKRRFDIRIMKPECVYIDDYAHHPKELEAFIMAVRQMFPGKKITGMFQPHLYSRTRDFADGFANSLDKLDEAWLLDIYPARELPIPGVSTAMILDRMELPHKKLVSRNEIIALLKAHKPEVFVTVGAGDIDQLVEPISAALS